MTGIILESGRAIAWVDDKDVEKLARYSWRLKKTKKDRTGYAYARIDGKDISMHRVLMPKAREVDHVNGDGLDNRRCNLRAASHVENMRNMRAREGKRFKGVGWYARYNKWRAYIQVDGVQKHLGYFTTEEEAARAYDAAAREHFGEFARPNLAA